MSHMPFATKPELDIDARRIFDRLDEASPGDIVTYEELSRILGRDVQKNARAALIKATRRQQRERLCLWETVRDQGVKLASDADIATTIPESARLKIARLTKREASKLATIQDLDALPRELKTSVLASQSYLGAIAQFSRPASVKALEDGIEKAGEQKALPLAKTMELFSK